MSRVDQTERFITNTEMNSGFINNIKFGILVSKSIIIRFTECFHEHKTHISKFKSHNNFKKKPNRLGVKENI